MTATIVPFQYDAKGSISATELQDGDLLCEGFSLRYDEIDRDGEAWVEDAKALLFQSVQRFLKGNAPLVHHHDPRVVLGRVLEAENVPGVGIRTKAVIDYQEPSSPWRHLYLAAKRGRLSKWSWGGLFKRVQTPEGPRLVDADFVELSACASSIGRQTDWSVVQAAALSAEDGKAVTATGGYRDARAEDLKAIKAALTDLKGEAMFWKRREPTPDAHVIHVDSLSPGQHRALQDQQARQSAIAFRNRGEQEAKVIDKGAVETVAEVSAEQRATIYGTNFVGPDGRVDRGTVDVVDGSIAEALAGRRFEPEGETPLQALARQEREQAEQEKQDDLLRGFDRALEKKQ